MNKRAIAILGGIFILIVATLGFLIYTKTKKTTPVEETVVETYQAGYYHEEGENKQSIRPARVKVGKPQS